MKTLFRIAFFGLFLFLAYNYFENRGVDVREWIAEGQEWLTEQLDELQPVAEPEAEPAEATQEEPIREESRSDAGMSKSISRKYNDASIQSSQTKTWPGSVQAREEKPITETKLESYKSLDSNLPTNNADWIKAVTEQYSPNSWNLLMSYEGLPSRAEAPLPDGSIITSNKPVGTFHYLEGGGRMNLLSSMETNVHELAHAYFRQNSYKYAKEQNILLDWDRAEGFLYISPSESYFVSLPKESLFPSRNLSSVIPHHLRTFRYDTYIEGHTSTQSEGVVGLLNELHAYYLGSKFSYDMLDVYQNALESDTDGMLQWLMHSMSSMTAFYEFDFFIKEYLLYMKNNHSADYSSIKSNQSFQRAYAAVQRAYVQLIDNYRALIKAEMDRMNKSGIAEVSIKGTQLWIKPANSRSSSGIAMFSDDRERLEEVLESGRYLEIEKDFLR